MDESEKNGAGPKASDEDEKPDEFARFESLTKQLLTVPKSKLDEERERERVARERVAS